MPAEIGRLVALARRWEGSVLQAPDAQARDAALRELVTTLDALGAAIEALPPARRRTVAGLAVQALR